MQRRAKTFAAGLVLTIGTTTTGLLMGSTTASAAEPVLAGSCGATVQGKPGAPVTLNAGALLTPVNNVLGSLPLLGNTLKPLVGSVIGALPPLPIGSVQAGDSTIGGGAIGAAATTALNGTALAPVAVAVGDLLANTCTVTVKVVNDVAAPVQTGVNQVGEGVGSVTSQLPQVPNLLPNLPGTGGGSTPGGGIPGGSTPGGSTPGGSTPGTGGTGGSTTYPRTDLPGGTATSLTPGGVPLFGTNYNFGRSPMLDYSSMPYALAALYSPSPGVRYGGSVPGYSPEFGILGADQGSGTVAEAGHAEALGGSTGNRIAVPVLLAVLALSGVTAALVRTWVLRRTVA